MQLNVGDILEDRYKIEAPIAKGGMSTVYRCLDTRLGRRVAAKVMNERYVNDPVFRQRFHREAQAMARINHPNLVGVYDFSSQGQHLYLIMELITGGTLRELLAERGPMPPHAAVAVMREVLKGLDAVHQTGLVHRDLKPDNILISSHHQVKLSDFGLVRAAAHDGDQNSIVGTVSYLSPEQVSGASITPASDVYSAGLVLFELLTGETPFTGESDMEKAFARLDIDVPVPSSQISGVPKLIDELVVSSCSFSPSERFNNASEFLLALEDVAEELQLPDFTVPVPRDGAASRAAEGIIEDDNSAMFTTALTAGEMSENPVDSTTVLPVIGSNEETSILATESAPDFDALNETTTFAPVNSAPRYIPEPVTIPYTPPVTAHNRGKGRLIAWTILALILTIAVAIGGWWFGSGRYGEIPQVIGMERVAAERVLSEAGFSTTSQEAYANDIPVGFAAGTDPQAGGRQVKGDVVTLLVSKGRPRVPDFRGIANYPQILANYTLAAQEGEPEFSSDIPAGEISRVEPEPGTEVLTQSVVTVHRSKGPEPVTVPEVKGQTSPQARTILEEAGFNVIIEKIYDETMTDGKVIKSDPPAGEQAAKGQDITISVSTAVVLPEVVGLDAAEVRSQLEDLGVKVKATKRASSATAAGFSDQAVATLDPPPGTLIDADAAEVTIIVVSRISVPDFVGLSVADAARAARDAGLSLVVASSADDGAIVTKQSPKAGKSVKPGQRITATVS
ncbi:Stk1 family PASTA domain-containing Ser/Thr kinase [Corynebacterium sp. ES2775-CONJ]|uniref:Stk1 family PASTA domain-containing Ser/Thr kinase n=1 Tax=Corynebacterium sp. ES2775-CONJ TaxID=2974029 RepID=UPI002168137F|nr:Stk1 family PASTA domain-containing Ser/Thr kinase [Corynebacterium sp. ES2775-CONJ]MCS4488999.1 Stk1 family PASTA domain-containing Ser/Thr kinase [Corynebacterium sp. ES2775-CONJ]